MRLRCDSLSDLRFLRPWQQVRLGRLITELPLQAASSAEWNDALTYLTGLPPMPDGEQARHRLLATLGGELSGASSYNNFSV